MSDHSELKRLAEEAIRQCDDGGKFAVALRSMQRYAGPTEVMALIAENERLEEDRERIRQQRMDYARKNDALHDQVGQLKAELESVQPYFEDVERLCKVLGYLGVSTPEGGEEQAARWLSLVRTMIRTAETSKLLRHDAEKIAEYDQLKAENAGLKTGYQAYEQVVQGLKAENVALVDAMNQIVRVTKLGDEAFGIACLVIGELSADANMGKEGQPKAK